MVIFLVWKTMASLSILFKKWFVFMGHCIDRKLENLAQTDTFSKLRCKF